MRACSPSIFNFLSSLSLSFDLDLNLDLNQTALLKFLRFAFFVFGYSLN